MHFSECKTSFGTFRLPQSAKHGRHHWHHLNTLCCHNIQHLFSIETAQQTYLLAHDERDNQRSQAEAMIERKSYQHALIAVDMQIAEQRKEGWKKLNDARLPCSLLVFTTRTARHHTDIPTSPYVWQRGIINKILPFYALQQGFTRYHWAYCV